MFLIMWNCTAFGAVISLSEWRAILRSQRQNRLQCCSTASRNIVHERLYKVSCGRRRKWPSHYPLNPSETLTTIVKDTRLRFSALPRELLFLFAVRPHTHVGDTDDWRGGDDGHYVCEICYTVTDENGKNTESHQSTASWSCRTRESEGREKWTRVQNNSGGCVYSRRRFVSLRAYKKA